MRILQVIHQFPPFSSQGSEVYCFNLSRQLNETDEVRVFHVSNTTRRWRRRLVRSTHAGLPIYHCIDWAEYARLADWSNAFLRSSFQAALDDFRPDVVHLHNFLSLGDDLVSRARASGAAIVYTLHDFGLICPNALLLRDDGELCSKQHPDFFQDCCPMLIRTDGNGRFRLGAAHWPSLARWNLFSRQHPSPFVRTLLTAAAGRATRWLGDPNTTNIERKRDFFLTHSRQIFHDADLFLAPSHFLLERYVSCGLPRAKVAHLPYGMRMFSVPHRENASGGIRFGYIGALHPQKGIELLLQAFRRIDQRASLHVYGSVFGSPISHSYWRRIRDQESTHVFFHGAYDNDQVGNILAQVDAVVVPSLWYENSPLTIQEAFIGRVPVITADCGGMAELVHDRINGLLFRLGDATDLRAKLLEVVEHPEILADLRRGIPDVVSMKQHASELKRRYQDLRR